MRPSRDHDGWNSQWSFCVVRRRGAPFGRDFTYRRPIAEYTTRSPCGDTLTQRSMRAAAESGATATGVRTASVTRRVSLTWNGISLTLCVASSTRCSPPLAQYTIERPSGVHAMPG